LPKIIRPTLLLANNYFAITPIARTRVTSQRTCQETFGGPLDNGSLKIYYPFALTTGSLDVTARPEGEPQTTLMILKH
jgi:hypothetical protein